MRELENVAQSAFTTFVFFPNSTESRCAFELQPIFGQFSQFIDSVSDQVRGSTCDLEIFHVTSGGINDKRIISSTKRKPYKLD